VAMARILSCGEGLCFIFALRCEGAFLLAWLDAPGA